MPFRPHSPLRTLFSAASAVHSCWVCDSSLCKRARKSAGGVVVPDPDTVVGVAGPAAAAAAAAAAADGGDISVSAGCKVTPGGVALAEDQQQPDVLLPEV